MITFGFNKINSKGPISLFPNSKRSSYVFHWLNIKWELINDITTNYFYAIDIYEHTYWEFSEVRNLKLNKKVVNDVRKGKAKILFIFAYEAILTHYSIKLSNDIDYMAINNNLPNDSIIIISGNYNPNILPKTNFLNHISYSTWEQSFFNYIRESFDNIEAIFLNSILSKTKRQKTFLSYNGKGRLHRVQFVYELWKQNLLKEGLVSLQKGDCKHFDYSGLEHFDNQPEFNKILPLEIKTTNLNPVMNLELEDYLKTYFNVVIETQWRPGELFFTEKTFKPIVAMQPFIILSCPGYLEFLKTLGYKTFSKWFDESYDDEFYLEKRIEKIIKLLHILSKKTHKKKQHMLIEMIPTLKHNRDNFKLISNTKILEKKLNNVWK